MRAAAGAAHKPSGMLQLDCGIVSSTRPLTAAAVQCRPRRLYAARTWYRGVATSAFGGDAEPGASFDGLISGGYTPLLTEEEAEADAAQRLKRLDALVSLRVGTYTALSLALVHFTVHLKVSRPFLLTLSTA